MYLPSDMTLWDPKVSPLYANLDELPPLLIQVADKEQLYDDSKLLAEKAKFQGVGVTLEVYKNVPHVFHFFGGVLKDARVAINSIALFINSHLNMPMGKSKL